MWGASVPLVGAGLERFGAAVSDSCSELARAIAADAEGATHLVTIEVEGLRDDAEARRVAKAVADSPLVKTAIYGADPNWGRIVSAAGYAGVAFEEGDLKPDQVALIATRLGVPEQDVVDMNRRLGGDASLNAPLREEGEGEWQDWLVDESSSQESILADREESDVRLGALKKALSVLNERERRIFEARRLADEPITLEDLSTEFGVSRERVRQIEVRAFEKVQAAVKQGVALAQVPTQAPHALPAM